uniref:Uncharacterized protein n=1 Tax=Myotis myotis TaxID=51298 RepID=A0A7J7WW27_MYOMY|nr:hypothetical protein mMyoMyo1_011998 [Myotis myotis]
MAVHTFPRPPPEWLRTAIPRGHSSQRSHNPFLALLSHCHASARSSDSPAFRGSWVSWLLTRDGGLVQASMAPTQTQPRFSQPPPPPPVEGSPRTWLQGLACPWEDRTTGTKLRCAGPWPCSSRPWPLPPGWGTLLVWPAPSPVHSIPICRAAPEGEGQERSAAAIDPRSLRRVLLKPGHLGVCHQ